MAGDPDGEDADDAADLEQAAAIMKRIRNGEEKIYSAEEVSRDLGLGEGGPDGENPEWTAVDFREARPGTELPSEVLRAFPNTSDPSEQLWRDLEKMDGDDTAAREHLAAGRPIYYAEDDTPPGLVIKEYPDGRRELVRVHLNSDDEVIRELAPVPPEGNEVLKQIPQENPKGAWDDFFNEPGSDLPDRDQPAMQSRDDLDDSESHEEKDHGSR
jgi:hypothetical protein